jgi:hypothetical protein
MSKGAWLVERHCNHTVWATTRCVAAQRSGNSHARGCRGPDQAVSLVGQSARRFHNKRAVVFLCEAWGLLKPTHKIAGADYAGRIESIAGTLSDFSRATKFLEHHLREKAREDLLSMFVFVKTASRRNHPICRSSKQQPCPSRRSLLFRVSAITVRSSVARRF